MSIKAILVEDSKKIQQEMIPALAELGDVQVIAVAESADEAAAAFQLHDASWQIAVVDLFFEKWIVRADRVRAGGCEYWQPLLGSPSNLTGRNLKPGGRRHP